MKSNIPESNSPLGDIKKGLGADEETIIELEVTSVGIIPDEVQESK